MMPHVHVPNLVHMFIWFSMQRDRSCHYILASICGRD